MDEYYSALANSLVQNPPKYSVDQELIIVNAAKKGSQEAQWLLWVIYNAFQKAGSEIDLIPKLTYQYITEIFQKCHETGQKLQKYFIWIQKERKILQDHQRMINSYLHHLMIAAIRKVNNCTRADAMLAYSAFAMSQTHVERKQCKEKFFDRINTLSKLEKELKYYSRGYSKWSFLFQNSRAIEFHFPGKYEDMNGIKKILESIAPSFQVES